MTGNDINRWNMATVHMVLDMLRMWLCVKIYKKAFESRRQWEPLSAKSEYFVLSLLLLEGKYKFIGIAHQFNDCFMIIFCLLSIFTF